MEFKDYFFKNLKGFTRLNVNQLTEILTEKKLVYNITLYKSFRDPVVLVNMRHGFINWNDNRFGIIIEKETKTYMNLNFNEDVLAGIYSDVAIHLETEEGLYVIFRLEPVATQPKEAKDYVSKKDKDTQ